MSNNKIIIIFGPTASGKTEYSISLAKQIGSAEIINADSMQIYKEIPIVTNQPTEEEKQNIPHHLFGTKSILEKSDLNQWLENAVKKIKEIRNKGKTPIVIGGTGMYLKSLAEGISSIPNISAKTKDKVKKAIEEKDLENAYRDGITQGIINPERIKAGDTQRIIRALEVYEETSKTIEAWNGEENIKFFDQNEFEIKFIDKDREEIYQRINDRFEDMVSNGALKEAEIANKIFKNSGLSADELLELPAYKAQGLRESISYINGEISLEEAINKAQQASRNYAKRQLTWWRGWRKQK